MTDKLEQARSSLELDQADIARAVDASARTVQRWFSGASEPRPEARERLLELLAVLERLSEVLRPEAAHDWLFTHHPMLDHHRPVDLLRGRDYRRVLAAVDVMSEGIFV